MRKIVTVVALVAVFCGGNLLLPAPAGAAQVGVSVGDHAFDPSTITVVVGDTVTWTVSSGLPHTVSADDGSFDSGDLNDGVTFSHTFELAGTYPYYCLFHGAPGGIGMSGIVIVEPASTDPTAPPSGPTSESADSTGGGARGAVTPTTSMPRTGTTGTSSPLYTG